MKLNPDLEMNKIPLRFRRSADDWMLVCLDYAQLELRVAALFHQDPATVKVLTDPEGDIHTNTSVSFSVARDPTAKQINFLLLYGGEEYVLSEKLTVEGVPTSKEEAADFRVRYSEVYYRIPEWRKELLEEHKKNGFIRLWTGRKRTLGEIDWSNRYEVHKAETTLSNNQVQGSGQDFLKAAIIRASPRRINPDRAVLESNIAMPRDHRLILMDQARKLEKYRRTIALAQTQWLLQVHDESIWRMRNNAADEVGHILAEIMTWRHYFPPLGKYVVPLVVDGGVGPTWADAKSKKCLRRIHYGFEHPTR